MCFIDGGDVEVKVCVVVMDDEVILIVEILVVCYGVVIVNELVFVVGYVYVGDILGGSCLVEK